MTPSHLGPWVLREVAGRGGHGIVWRAEHRETGALAAVKTLQRLSSDDRARLARELELLRRLDHPDVVSVVDHDVHAESPWIAMRWIDGPALSVWVPRAASPPTATPSTFWDGETLADPQLDEIATPAVRLEPGEVRERLDLVVRLCSALAWLHGEGRVHRDLKPSNVCVQDGRPVLLDLGIAVEARDVTGRELLDQSAGWSAGTAWYMAPEQIRGELVDGRTDLYALGCVLHVLLTGRPPFRGSPAAVLQAHQHRTPPAMAAHDPALAPLDAVVQRLLAKLPGDRFAYASDVADALVALGATPDEAPRPEPRTVVYRAPLIGREAALRAITRALDSAVDEGRAVVAKGASGSGKTRFILEVAQLARRRGLRVDTARGRPTSDPFGALSGLLGRESIEGSAQQRAWLAGQRIAQGPTPRVVLLDDLQDADSDSLSALDQLLRGGLPGGLVLVGACGNPGVPPTVARWLDEGLAAETVLPPLDVDGVTRLVQGMLALDRPPGSLGRRLHDRTEGNPLFVDAWLRGAVADGTLRRTDSGEWRLGDGSAFGDAELDASTLPDSMRAVVDRRIARLDDRTRDLLRAGALLGRRFAIADAAFVAGIDDPNPAVAEAVRTAIAQAHGEALVLTQRPLVEALRADVPAKNLTAWAARGATRLTADTDRLRRAELLELAGEAESARALFETVGREAVRGIEVTAWQGAIRCARTVEHRRTALTEIAQGYRRINDEEAARESLRQAIDLATSPPERLEPALQLAQIHNLHHQPAQALAVLEGLDAHVDGLARARLLQGLGSALMDLGRLEEAERAMREGLALADRRSDYLAGLLEVNVGLARYRSGDHQGALHYYERAIERSYADGVHPARRGAIIQNLALGNRANCMHQLGRPDEALQGALDAENHALRWGLRWEASRHAGNRGGLLTDRGELDAAVESLGRAARTAREGGRTFWELAFLVLWLRARRLQGAASSALQPSIDRVIARIAGYDNDVIELLAWSELTCVALRDGADPYPAFERAREATTRSTVPSGFHQLAWGRAQRAIARHEAGGELVLGECPEDLPPGVGPTRRP